MRRVVVTGMGIVSSIGNNSQEVLASLREGRSGIEFSKEYRDMGFRSHVHGPVKIDLDAAVDRKLRRFMGKALPGPLLFSKRQRILVLPYIRRRI